MVNGLERPTAGTVTVAGRDVGRASAEGVTATIPLAVLNRVTARGFDWLVPGMREELITELIRSLPKPIRRHLVPAPERAKAVAAALHDDDPDSGEPFVEAVADELVALPGVPDDLPLYGEEFQIDKLPAHLRMHFRVVDSKGKQVGTGDDLDSLKKRLKQRVNTSVSQQGEDIARTNLSTFPEQGVPAQHRSRVGDLTVTGYPALVVRSGADGRVERVDLKVLATHDEQTIQHRLGTIALVDRELDADLQAVLNALPNPTKLAVASSPYASTAALLEDASRAATTYLVGPRLIRAREEYEAVLDRVRAEHRELAGQVVRDAASALAVNARLAKKISKVSSLSVLAQLQQIREHAASLLGDGFISRTGVEHIGDLERYLRADEMRLEKLQENPRRDEQLAWQISDLEALWERTRRRLPAARLHEPDAAAIPWLLEELRVSLFAQSIGARGTVSDKRVRTAIASLG